MTVSNMRQFYFLLFLLAIASPSFAQLADNTYRNSNNRLYWQFRKPDGAYWQQDVHYKIAAVMHEDDNRIDGQETLEYWNNSPDTLSIVYFHLYQNAFIKGSYMHDLELANHSKPTLGKSEAAGLGIQVNDLLADGAPVKTEVDFSIMKVTLAKALLPGTKVTFTMKFNTWYDMGSTRRRMQLLGVSGYKHYNGCQWFPKISVYDRKFGWDTYQHLGKEFYGDFGSYDVSLDFPSNYVLEATGELQNRKEALPDTLRAKLDIKNFANKKWNESPSVITPYVKGERKTWKFHADNVHDFAFTADPTYRIGTTYWNGIECVALVQEQHAAGWQNGAELVANTIRVFSEDIGMYQYPKMVAADANDGMEYPMLTLDGGREPDYRKLLVHEIGHNWFYGMVGSNETYRAALDEGFTQFLTAWGLRRLDGYSMKENPAKGYRKHFAQPTDALDRNVLQSYTYAALNQNEEPLNTHSDDFHSALGHGGGYAMVYYKTASMLYNLQYALGDSLFLQSLQHYFAQWRFGHPYFEDFRASIIQYTHQDLNWFFDEWLETTKTIDYGITRIKHIPGSDSFAVKFRRTGQMQMPVDFSVFAKNDSVYNYTIPNTWFAKSGAATVLPKWYGWDKLEPTYTAHIHIPSGIRRVEIDTTHRLADIDPLDNYKTKGMLISPKAVVVKLDGGLNNPNDRRHYRSWLRPDVWWNPIDGIKLGVHLESDYLVTLHKVDAAFWWNTHVLQEDQYLSFRSEKYYGRYSPISYTFNYTSPLTRRMPKVQAQINSRYLDGLMYHRLGLNWLPNEQNTLQVYAQTMWRPNGYDLDYLLDPNEWSSTSDRINTSLNASWRHRYNYIHGDGAYAISLRAPFLNGNNSNAFNYAYAQFESINTNHIGKLDVRTRLFGRYGTGSVIPSESALYLSGANPESLMEDKYTRSVGFVPTDWEGTSRYQTSHFQQGGGLNLRGYSGYFAADERNGETLAGYKGRSGVSASIELDVDNYINYAPKQTKNWLHVDAYIFADAGIIELSRYTLPEFYNNIPTTMWSDVRVDAGPGLAFTVKSWGVFEKAKPLTLRVDFPLFINRAPFANPQYFAFRWVVGINRSF